MKDIKPEDLFDIEDDFEHIGYRCVILRHKMAHRKHRCGYVSIPKDHPLWGTDYDDMDDINVHGGVTYSSSGLILIDEKDGDDWWIGFDCAHLGDDQDGGQSLPYVRRQCKLLAENLDEYMVLGGDQR